MSDSQHREENVERAIQEIPETNSLEREIQYHAGRVSLLKRLLKIAQHRDAVAPKKSGAANA